ncbi:hypothetical protein [Bacillus atrophaeus]|uniref:hypothetical protein n=1 Tax=Bacillus atrophaeus TaxID=1452 RepID=UPI002017E972|nr:hypothetical protein [Bacillus atrophaeus]
MNNKKTIINLVKSVKKNEQVFFLDNQTEIKKQADAELGFDSKQFLETIIKGERD